MAKTDLTAQIVRELLHYDPETGVFTWLPRRLEFFSKEMYAKTWNTQFAGKEARGLSNGYLSIRVLNRAYWSHRLAWLYMHGEWPLGFIDHINGDKHDNRIQNLRDVSRQTNAQNLRVAPKKCSNTPLGVFFNHRKIVRRFSASIMVLGKTKHLGYFDTEVEAHNAYLNAKRQHHQGCTI